MSISYIIDTISFNGVDNLLNPSKEKGTLEIINSKDDNLIKRSYEILDIDNE